MVFRQGVKNQPIFVKLTLQLIKLYEKGGGCAGKPLQRHIKTFCYLVFKPITKITSGDIVCDP
jgi:hypothetical protein